MRRCGEKYVYSRASLSSRRARRLASLYVVPGCFAWSTTRASTIVAPKQQAQWDARLAYLKEVIEMWALPEAVVPEPQEGRCVFTHELFYDNVVDSVDDAERAARIARFKQAAKEKKRKRET